MQPLFHCHRAVCLLFDHSVGAWQRIRAGPTIDAKSAFTPRLRRTFLRRLEYQTQ
jgi:hypothetical protein